MLSIGSSMKSYARLGEQCGSVGREAGSLKEEAHSMLAASGLEEHYFGPGNGEAQV